MVFAIGHITRYHFPRKVRKVNGQSREINLTNSNFFKDLLFAGIQSTSFDN